MPAAVSVLILLVLDGNLGEMHENVLHLGVSAAALGTSKVVQPGPLVEQVVDDGDDDDDTDGVCPDDNDSDDGGVAVGKETVVGGRVGRLSPSTIKPTEHTEDG